MHISEVNVVGAKDQRERVTNLRRILSLALQTGCDSIGFWNILRARIPDQDKNEPYNEAQNIFNADYEPIPGNGYDEIVDALIQSGKEKGLL